MRHAFLIVAHANPRQLGDLVSLLDDPQHDIYIHIDRRAQGFDEGALRGRAHSALVRIFREYSVYWGDVTQMLAPLYLMKQASAAARYDYYHILSGMDLPLRTNAELHEFFERNPDREFLSVRALTPGKDAEKIRRTQVWHLLTRRRAGSKLAVALDRALIGAQLALGVNRLRGETWQIMYGSNWASLTHDFVRCVCDHEEKLLRLFRKTNNADELYLQTVAYNCGFMNRIYQPKAGERVNLHYTDWKRGNGRSPYTFRIEDYEMLRENINPFARKFSETVDREIIDRIIADLRARALKPPTGES